MRDIYVYGDIGDSWGECVTARAFVRQLDEAAGDDVTVHINSAGGDVFDAAAMAESIRAYKGRTTASIEGLAASAASYFALTADEVVMNKSALLMVHNPHAFACGEADELRGKADLLDKVKGTIVSQYVRKTGMDEGEVSALMDAETWMSADEALDRGFVDALSDAEPVAACVSDGSLKSFSHVPDSLKGALAAAAGESGSTIAAKGGCEPEPGAGEGGAGAVPRVVCMNGTFLRL